MRDLLKQCLKELVERPGLSYFTSRFRVWANYEDGDRRIVLAPAHEIEAFNNALIDRYVICRPEGHKLHIATMTGLTSSEIVGTIEEAVGAYVTEYSTGSIVIRAATMAIASLPERSPVTYEVVKESVDPTELLTHLREEKVREHINATVGIVAEIR